MTPGFRNLIDSVIVNVSIVKMDSRDFFRTSGVAGLAIAGGAAGSMAASSVSAAAPPKRPRILIRGACIVTLDPKIGELRGRKI